MSASTARTRDILRRCVGMLTAVETETMTEENRLQLWDLIMQCLAEIHWLGKEIKEKTNHDAYVTR